MINDMFGLFYVARDSKKFNVLMSKYKKVREKIRPNEWMKKFISSFGNEEIKDKKITVKQADIFLGCSEAICQDSSSIIYAFKYAGMVYYICVIHGKYYHLTMKKEVV